MPIDPLLTTATTSAAMAGAWLWDNYGRDILNWLGGKTTKNWERVNWGRAARKYRSNLDYIYSTTRILGKSEPVNLGNIYTDVYILDQPTASRRYDIEQLKKTFNEDRYARSNVERQNGLSLIRQQDKGHRLFILGKPGAGKTTFLRYITLQATGGQIDKIPIFVSLKEWSDSGSDLLTFIVKQFEICDFPDALPFVEHILKSGKAIVLFDGLDEINEEDSPRPKANTLLNNFCMQYHHTQCLITCRIAATDRIFEPFTYVEMADFTDEQIRTFAERWFPNRDTQRKFLEEFFNTENERLQELGRIPLLLTLLCLTFEENHTFPQRRVDVYQEAIDVLLKKWDSSREIRRDNSYRLLSIPQKKQMLAQIAAETFKEGEYFLRQRNLENRIVKYLHSLSDTNINEDIDGEAILKSVEAQHGLFVERARQIYSFSHLTFQEYFTAEYFLNAKEDELKSLIYNHLGDNRWREVFLLTASLLEDNANIFFAIFRQAVDNLISSEQDLIKFLSVIEQVAAKVEARFKTSAIRSACCYYAFSRISNHDLNRALACTLDLTRGLGLDLNFDFSRAPSRDYDRNLRRVKTLALESKIPSFKTTKIEQIRQLTRYMEANKLLVDCLNLSDVSNRDEIENNLLLPPKR